MSAVRPAASWMGRWLYKPSSAMFELPERLSRPLDRYLARQAAETSKKTLLTRAVEHAREFVKEFTNLDHDVFYKFRTGDQMFMLAQAPKAAWLLFCYPFMVGARMIKSWRRDEHQNRLTGAKGHPNFWDVCRRDMLVITSLLFFYDPLLYAFNRLKERWSGVKLADRKSKKVLGYSQFENYRIDSPKALLSLISGGNGKGLLKAVNGLDNAGLFEQGGEPLRAEVTGIRQKVSELLRLCEGLSPEAMADNPTVTALSQEIFAHVEAGENILAESLKKAEAVGSKKLVATAKKLQGTLKNAVVQHARMSRLPFDILGFSMMLLAMGWFPVWFNSLWNRKKFEESQQQGITQASSSASFSAGVQRPVLPAYDAHQTWQTLNATSRLGQNRFRM